MRSPLGAPIAWVCRCGRAIASCALLVTHCSAGPTPRLCYSATAASGSAWTVYSTAVIQADTEARGGGLTAPQIACISHFLSGKNVVLSGQTPPTLSSPRRKAAAWTSVVGLASARAGRTHLLKLAGSNDAARDSKLPLVRTVVGLRTLKSDWEGATAALLAAQSALCAARVASSLSSTWLATVRTQWRPSSPWTET